MRFSGFIISLAIFVGISYASTPSSKSVTQATLLTMKDCLQILVDENNSFVTWDSTFFTGKQVTTADQARAIMGKVATDPRVRAELQDIFGTATEVYRKDPRMWNMYVRAYDNFTPYSTGYLELVGLFDKYLPREGIIADFGTATASIPAMLLHRAPKRFFHLYDFSKTALSMGETKMDHIRRRLTASSPFELFPIDVTRIDWTRVGFFNAVMINNLLSNLEGQSQRMLLRHIANHLPIDGIVIVSELDGDEISSGDELLQVGEKVAISAVANGAPGTDYQLALLAYINREILAARFPPFLTAKKRKELWEYAGLRVIKEYPRVYHGANHLTILGK